MTLETGLFCIVQSRAQIPEDGSGLPGIRISPPPGRPHGVSISSFRDDGWLGGQEEAALVRVTNGPAQILVTIYQSPAHGSEAAPKLQVLRLSPDREPASEPDTPAIRREQSIPGAAPPEGDVVAHLQGHGDVVAALGDWIGARGSRLAVEGFCIAPKGPVTAGDVEYQAILGRDWTSPWVSGGAFCGSRGMALPLLGFRLRLKGEAASAFECRYAATFVDGSSVGPVAAGDPCQAPSLAPLEAFLLTVTPRAAAIRFGP